MKFTKEEISLCKQVAEGHKKEVKCGDWILINGELRLNLDGKLAWLEDGKQDIIITITTKKEIIPLWTISDCLEWLKEKKLNIFIEWDNSKKRWWIGLAYGDSMPHLSFESKTLLEACLRAILAVLEEKE